jgi:hypothetical protein
MTICQIPPSIVFTLSVLTPHDVARIMTRALEPQMSFQHVVLPELYGHNECVEIWLRQPFII